MITQPSLTKGIPHGMCPKGDCCDKLKIYYLTSSRFLEKVVCLKQMNSFFYSDM